jgi:hypothetical protein
MSEENGRTESHYEIRDADGQLMAKLIPSPDASGALHDALTSNGFQIVKASPTHEVVHHSTLFSRRICLLTMSAKSNWIV